MEKEGSGFQQNTRDPESRIWAHGALLNIGHASSIGFHGKIGAVMI
jgi:hypothetical protein